MSSNSKTLLGFILVSLALFTAWALLGGQYRNIGAMRAAIVERDQLIAEREGVMKNVDTLYGQYQAHQRDISRFESVMPQNGNIAEIVSALDVISRQAGMQLIGIAVQGGNRNAQETTGSLTIPVQLLGSYESLSTFLGSIEQNLRLLDIISISIAPDPISVGLLHFEIQIVAYFVN